ncbi:MAG: adenylyl-sulfate kinase, partial [Oscillospiraceae bacterium]|nr:adenylyl-sulfate kinase [Oscillospiraceae bacterium]
MAYKLADINAAVRRDPAGFMEECDRGYQDKIARAAEKICENMKKSPVVLLSGPSGSGKTTTAEKLSQELERRGVRTHAVSMDDYFIRPDPDRMPRTPDGAIDYESPEMMDLKLLDEHFAKLTRGEWILVPRFEFARQMRNDSRGTPLKLGEDEVAIFEGIHALNTQLTNR